MSVPTSTPGAVLAWVAVVSLSLSLGSTIFGFWTKSPDTSKEFFELTKLLLSWQVIAGGLTGLGARKFETEIRHVLRRLAGHRLTKEDLTTPGSPSP
jgi:hypothetical protein